MNKSQQIYFDPNIQGNDLHVKVKLEQDVDTIEFMTMTISTEDIYQNFNADYGVLVGHVIANGGVGIPNAKISVFIPLTDEDSANSGITSTYPYKTPRDKNNEGKRYNLLPRVSKIDPITNQIHPKQAFGSFPIKEELITNVSFLNVYKKYYKYTATTNDAGDYMIFGIPIGTQTIHLSVDITDIGKYSMTPAAMVTNLGYSPNLFTNNNTEIKPSSDLNDLPNIETQEISVNIVPFWGDTTNFEIGITRQDFRIRAVLKNTFVLFGSVFTDGDNSMWGENNVAGRYIYELFRIRDDGYTNVGILSKRIGKITEKIYYYPPSISDYDIDNNFNVNYDGSDMLLLSPSEYSIYKRDGDFAIIISCNRNKIITVNGKEVNVDYSSSSGIYTKFRGFITLEITPDDIPMNFSGSIGNNTVLKPFRYTLKFPQYSEKNQSFNKNETLQTPNWRKEHFQFEAGKFYSLAKFHGITSNDRRDDSFQGIDLDGFFSGDIINNPYNSDPFWNVGIIVSGNVFNDIDPSIITYNNEIYEFPSNTYTDQSIKSFGGNWLNLGIYLPQLGFLESGYAHISNVRSADHFSFQVPYNHPDDFFKNYFYYYDNDQIIAANQTNTKWFARSDLNWTDIINVPITDLNIMLNMNKKGFINSEVTGGTLTINNYRNGINIPSHTTRYVTSACPLSGGTTNGDVTNYPANLDTNTYFYKGFGKADCVEFLSSLGLIS